MIEMTKRARELRQKETNTEALFWDLVRNRKTGYKFVRQKPLRYYIGEDVKYFIADFYSSELKLVVELDGKIHENQKEYDEARNYMMNQMQLRVARVSNEEFLKDPMGFLNNLLSSPELERRCSRKAGTEVRPELPGEAA